MTNIAILSSHNGSGFETLYLAAQKNILDIDIKLVISNNTKAGALEKAKKYNIDNYIVNSKTSQDVDETIYDLVKKNECEYIFLSGYMKKISPRLTNNFKIINSHPSLLPKYGGVGMYGRLVHEAVVKNNEKSSGVTIHEVNEKYDDGKVILQKELLLTDGETPESLETKIKELETVAIVEAFTQCLK